VHGIKNLYVENWLVTTLRPIAHHHAVAATAAEQSDYETLAQNFATRRIITLLRI
jgi:hypothetical protein